MEREFRNALGMFATGVTIITTRTAEGEDVGRTASSFNSVSLDPPMVLWSLARASSAFPAFQQTGFFAAHVLGAGQQDLAMQFARRGADRFAGISARRHVTGAPLLADCMALFECRVASRYDGGDHLIFVGEVVHFERGAGQPLIFHAGRFSGLAEE